MTDTIDTLREHASPPPSNGKGGFMTFWSSIPGVLTAGAAVITAVTGLYLNTAPDDRTAAIPAPPATTAPTVPTPTVPTPTVPTPTVPTIVVVDMGALADRQVTEVADRDEALMFAIDGCEAGDQDSCVILFEELVNGCEAGIGVECDVLYLLSDAGSDLEEYGATCGYRFPDDYANDCESSI